ncbi:MAG: STAS/SEC14 domain-containing protein [Pseudomonadota bacterium]
MKLFSYGPITQMAATSSDVYAFRVAGNIDDDAAGALAEFMNKVFDERERVSMLLDLTAYTGSDWDAMFDGDVIESRFRALTKVAKYAVVGAPDRATKMIGIMDKIIPVEAKAFGVHQTDKAWAFVGAAPADSHAA